ncbi:MAG: hypothetical protein K2N06_03550 [Oscillospiraceae bacterium]|nr:hypothetical protein [Oscillospiraceae bacterium]
MNPCLDCDCYDPDLGCIMPSLDKSYACSLESDDFDFSKGGDSDES